MRDRPDKKKALSVYLDPDIMRILADFAGRRGQSRSIIAEAAIASFLSPDADERQEAAIAKRLDRIDRNLQRLERDIGIANEALAAQQQSARLTLAEAATDRARLDQLRSTNTVLTQENQRLKASLARGAAAVTPPAAVPNLTRTHLVAAGDSLSNLSDRYYGTPGRWREIYVANADLLGPTGTLRIGTTLRIP